MTTVITNLKFINKLNIFYFLALGMFRKVSFIVLPKAFKYTNIIAFNFFFFLGMRESCVQCVFQVTVNANIVYTSRYILYIFPDTGFAVSSSHFIFVSQTCFKNLNVFCFLPFALICMHSFSYLIRMLFIYALSFLANFSPCKIGPFTMLIGMVSLILH